MNWLRRVAGGAAAVVGTLVRVSRSVPGVAGAIMISVGAAALTGRPPVGMIVGGGFLLLLDRRL